MLQTQASTVKRLSADGLCSPEEAENVLEGMVKLLLSVKQIIDDANQKAQVYLGIARADAIYNFLLCNSRDLLACSMEPHL